MNYCVAAFGIILLISTIQWFVDGRKNYHGPQIDMEAMRKGEVIGVTGDLQDDGRAQPEEGIEKDEI